MERAVTSAAKRGGTSSVKRTNTYGRSTSKSASLVTSNPGSGKENSLLHAGHTGAKSRSNGLAAILTHDFDNDDDDTFGAVGRSKRNRGGVCGTPTDEDGSERPRVTSPRLQDVVRHHSIFDACNMEAPPSKLDIPKLSGIPPCAEGGSSPPFTKSGGRAYGSNGSGGGSSTGGNRRTKGAYTSKASGSSGNSKKQGGSEEEKLIAKAPLEDVQHLHAALVKCTKQSTRGGFGKKPAVSCGSSWPLPRRERFVDWVFSLGFTPDVTGKWYECASAEQGRSLTRTLADAMASAAAAAAAAAAETAAASAATAAAEAADVVTSGPTMDDAEDQIEEGPIEGDQRSRGGAKPVKRRPGAAAAAPTRRRTQPSIDEDDIEEFPEDFNDDDGGGHPNDDIGCDDDSNSNGQPFGGFTKGLRVPERPTLRRMASNVSNTSSEDSLASTQSSASSTATTSAATVMGAAGGGGGGGGVGLRTRSSRLRDRRGLVRAISLTSSHDSAISSTSSSSCGGSNSAQSTPRSGGGGSARSSRQQSQQLRRSGSGGSSPDSGANLTPQRRLSSSVDWDAAGKESRLARMVNGSGNDGGSNGGLGNGEPRQAPTRTVSDPLRGASYSSSAAAAAAAANDGEDDGSAKTAEGADLFTARRVRSRTNSEDVTNSQSSGSCDDLHGAWRKSSSSQSLKSGLPADDLDHNNDSDDDVLDPAGVLLQPRRPPSALANMSRATSATLPATDGPPMLVSAGGDAAAGVGRRRKALTRSASTPMNSNRPHASSDDSFLSVSRPRRGPKSTQSSSTSSSSSSSSAMEPDSAPPPPPTGEGMLRQPLLRVNSLGPLADNLNGMHLFSAASHGRGGRSSSPRLSLSQGDLQSNLQMRGLLDDEDDGVAAAGAPDPLTSATGCGRSRDFDDDDDEDGEDDGNDFGIGLGSLREVSREQSRCASDTEDEEGEGAASGGGGGTQETEVLTQETEIDDDDEFHSCNSHFHPTPFACLGGSDGANGAADPLETSGGSDHGSDTSATGGGFLRRPAKSSLGGARDSMGSDDGTGALFMHHGMSEAHNPMLQQHGSSSGGRSSNGFMNGAGHQRYSYSGRSDRNSSGGLHHHGQQQVPPARSSNSRLSGASATDSACGGNFGRDRDSFGAAHGEQWDMMDVMAGFSHSSARRPSSSSSTAAVVSRSSTAGGSAGGSGRLSAGLSGPLFQDVPASSAGNGAGQQSSSGPTTPMLQPSSMRFGSAQGFGPGAASNGSARYSLTSGCVLGSFGGSNGNGGSTPMQKCPTPGPAATPQQTPQQLMGWGARPDFGDWGATVGLAAGPLRQLIERFEQQRATMQSRGQLSPFCRGRYGPLTMAINSSASGEGTNPIGVPAALPAMPSLVIGPPSQVGGPTNLFGTGSPTGSPSSISAAAGAGAAPMLPSSSSSGVQNLFFAAGAAGSSLALGPSFGDRGSSRNSSSSVSPPRPGTTMSAAHGVSFAPDVSPVHGSSGHGADGGGAENGDVAFNSAEKDRARARRARSLAKFHRVSVGMSARKSLGGSRSSIGGGGINGRPSLLLGVLAAGVEYSTHQYSVRRSNVKPAEGGASRNELGAPPAKPRFSLATGGMHSMHSNSSGCANAGGITMDSFRGVSIVGGQFLRRFEAGLPVVGLPAQLHAAQVVGADLTHTGLLKLTVHHPTTGARKTVQIFTTRNRCHTLRVFPTGLLVSAQAFAASSSSSSGGGGGSRSGGAGAKVAYFLKQELYQFTGLLDALAPTLANNVSDAASWTAAASLPLPPPLALELQLPPHPSQSALASNAPTTTTTPRAHRNAPLRSCRASQGAAAGSRDSNAADDDDDDGMMRDPGVTPGPSLGSHNTKDGGGGSAVKHSGVTPALDAMNIFSPISGGGKMDHDGNDADVFVNMALESSVCMDEISGLENDDDDEASAALSNSFRRGLRVATPTASGALLVAASGGAAATAAAPTAAASNKAKHDEELVDSDTDTAIDDDEDLAATQLTQECDAELMHYGASDLPVLLTAHILSFLTVADLLQGPLSTAWGFSGSISSGSAVATGGCVAVCRAWSVAAAHAHASLVAAAAVADPSTSSAAATSRSNGASSNGPPVALNLRSGGRSTAASSEQQQQQPPPLVRQRSMLPPGAAKSATSKGGAVIVKSWAMLCDHMPWGAFLSEGAYKKVYRVVNAQAMPPAIMAAKHQWDSSALAACGGGGSAAVAGVEWVQEAVSVMNVKAIIENGAGSVVQQELKVSLLVSSLVRRGTCPNFVETFGVFGADFAPPPEVWGSEERKQPHGKSPSAYPQLPLKLANQLNARGTAAAVESSSSSSSSNSGAAGEKENAQAVREHHSAAVKSLQPWRGDAAKRVRASSSLPRGRHQYIRMELCTHGDLEVFLQKQPTLTLTNEALPPLAFQMVFSLYCAQQEFSLRHYDVKLLNFLLKEVPPTLTSQAPLLQSLHKKGSNGACSSLSSSSGVGALASQQEGEEEVAVSYGVPGQAFRFTLPAATGPTSHRLWVKLGDFGTADVNPATLGAPVGLEQFTTLENTPIEQLLLGAGATQAYAADTWALGLSLLHLFTGHAPYEELMVDVVCPDELRLALEAVWQDPALEAQYGVVADAAGEEEQASIDMDLSSSDILDGGGGGMDRTLADTLYRYVVLCGLPEAAVVDATPAWHQNPILRACLVHLRTGDLPGALQRPGSSSGRGRGSGAPTKAAAKKLASAFEKHRNLWSLAKGNAPPMAAARTKLDAMGGAVLLQDMLAFDPLQRPTMLEALQSDLFSDLRCADSEARAAHHAFLKYL